MAVILALDSSTEACSCALLTPDGLFERYVVRPREHTRLMLPLIEELLAEAGFRLQDLDALAYGRGPGSFTGLRIAAGVVQGLAFGLDRPVLSVSTLEALALQVLDCGAQSPLYLACIDARIDEVYWAFYATDQGMPRRLDEEHLSKPELLRLPEGQEPAQPMVAVGNGLCYRERMPAALSASMTHFYPAFLPRAREMVRIAAVDFAAGRSCRPEAVEPVYLRDKVTHG